MRDLRTTVHGNVTKEPTVHRYEDGTVTAIIRLASTSRYFDPDRKEFADRKTEFFTVYARRALARHVEASVHKGDPLIVSGRLGSAEWTRDGVTGHSMTIQADAIGPDLTFGTAVFQRARRPEAPRIDERTGEVLDGAPGTMVGGAGKELAEREDIAEDDLDARPGDVLLAAAAARDGEEQLVGSAPF